MNDRTVMDARSSGGLGCGSAAAPAGGRTAGEPRPEGPLCVDMRRPGEMHVIADAWRQLAGRALESSVFAEPGFLLPALQHAPEGRHVAVLCVWRGPPQAGGLLGLVPVLAPRRAFSGRGVRFWRPPLSLGSAALIDKDAADAVIEAVLSDLADRGATSLLLPGIPLQGDTASVLRALARRTQRSLVVSPSGDRPGETATADPIASPRLEADDSWRRLGALGEVRIERAQDTRLVRDAVEEFLVLEAQAGGSAALIRDLGMATFVRTMTRELARGRRCRVDVMRVGGRPVAAAIVLKSGQRAWLWRIARDERLADCVLDALLALELARTQGRRTHLHLEDACGLRNHPLVDHLGGEPTPQGDVLIAVTPEASPMVRPLHGSYGVTHTLCSIARHAYAGLTRKQAPAP